MAYKKEDWDLWEEKYVQEGKTIQQISEELNVNRKTISKKLTERGVMRPSPVGQKGLTPWNKDKTGVQDAWNKGMKDTYPYPSGFKGKISPFRGQPRSQETCDKIAHTKRTSRFDGYCVYQERLEEEDTLYLITVKDREKGNLFKIGRTFQSAKKRHGSSLVTVHQLWKAPHKIIVGVEYQVLVEFEKYSSVAKFISGRTECFSLDLPIDRVIDFIDMAISSQAESTLSEGSETTGEI